MKGYSDDITGTKMYYDDKGQLQGYEVKMGDSDKSDNSVQGWGIAWSGFDEAPISHIFGWIWWIACCVIPMLMLAGINNGGQDSWMGLFTAPIAIVVEVVLYFTVYIWLRLAIEKAEINRRKGKKSRAAVRLKDNIGKILLFIYIATCVVAAILEYFVEF